MASKSKRARQIVAKAKTKSAWPVIIWALVAAYAGYLQNRYGQFSDIRGFYGTRFMNGQHDWPYESVTPQGGTGPLPPIEYPAITGVAIWLLTFITPQTGIPLLNYFGINALIHGIFFAGTGYYIKKLTTNSLAYLFVLAPACFMALNLNWDMWAVFPMVASIYYFDKEKRTISGILLGVAIAAKFFPLILLLPIGIFFLKGKKINEGLKYLVTVMVTWLAFNLPVMIVSFDGWKYFYTFSFNRGLGDGSIFFVLAKIGTTELYSNLLFYILNIVLFGILIAFLFKSEVNLSITQTAFLTMFCFTYFGKQYSMQYVLWLAPLAVMAISELKNRDYLGAIYIYGLWQVTEIAFRYAYFQNAMARFYAGKGTPLSNPLTDLTLGTIGIIRYIAILVLILYLFLRTNRNVQHPISSK
jgi:hypothetical protein